MHRQLEVELLPPLGKALAEGLLSAGRRIASELMTVADHDTVGATSEDVTDALIAADSDAAVFVCEVFSRRPGVWVVVVISRHAKDVALAGVSCELTIHGGEPHIYVIKPDGRKRFKPFQRESYAFQEVQRFEAKISDAAADENLFQQRRPTQIAECEAVLQQAQEGATSRRAAASAERARVLERKRQDPRLAEARTAMQKARIRWEEHTGRRPR